MTAMDATESVQEMLSDVTNKVSKSHWLLSGIVEAAVHPTVRSSAQESLDVVADSVTELRELAAVIGRKLRAGAHLSAWEYRSQNKGRPSCRQLRRQPARGTLRTRTPRRQGQARKCPDGKGPGRCPLGQRGRPPRGAGLRTLIGM